MTKAGADDWKTPLGYYERAIAELRRTREEIQSELQNLKLIDDFTFDLSASEGHLPSNTNLLRIDAGRVEDRVRFLLSRRDLQV